MASSSAPRNDRLADSYDSQSAFFEACKQLCQRTCGTISHDNNKTDNYARACCRLRRTQDCQWAVSAKLRDDGQWYIVTDTARWEHNHEWVDASQSRSSTGSEPVVMNNRKTRRVRSETLTEGSDDDEYSGRKPRELEGDAESAESVLNQTFFGDPLWSVSSLTTRVRAMRDIVKRRGALLERVRAFGSDDVRKRALNLALVHIATHIASNSNSSHLSSSFPAWKAFCAEQDIPCLPIIADVVCLFAWYLKVKNKWLSGFYDCSPTITALAELQERSRHLWHARSEEEQVALQMRVRGHEALESFLKERQSLPGSGPRSRPTTSTPPPSPSFSRLGDEPAINHAAKQAWLRAPRVTAGQTFDSPQALLKFYSTNVVPVLGYDISKMGRTNVGVVKYWCNKGRGDDEGACPYQIVLEQDAEGGGWVVQPAPASKLEHGHGPSPKIVEHAIRQAQRQQAGPSNPAPRSSPSAPPDDSDAESEPVVSRAKRPASPEMALAGPKRRKAIPPSSPPIANSASGKQPRERSTPAPADVDAVECIDLTHLKEEEEEPMPMPKLNSTGELVAFLNSLTADPGLGDDFGDVLIALGVRNSAALLAIAGTDTGLDQLEKGMEKREERGEQSLPLGLRIQLRQALETRLAN